MAQSYYARYVFPIVGPPIEHGVVTVAGGKIASVEPARSPSPGDVDVTERLGCQHAAILPALVNAHTHLEFSDLAKPLGRPGMAFPDWIRTVIEHRRQASPEHSAAIADGLRESQSCGVGTLGEIATHDDLECYSSDDGAMSTVVFRELLGLSDEAIAAADRICASLAAETVSRNQGTNVVRGLSPHAPYSTHPKIVERTCRASSELKLPVAMHLAESREELELLATRGGPFRQLLEDLEVWNLDAFAVRTRPLDYLRQLSQAHRALVVHGNYLNDEEIAYLADHADKMTVVYCPRTHQYFQHDLYPLQKLITTGVPVALGTDSRASNPDLNLWREVITAARSHPDVDPARILEMATVNGAKVLGVTGRGTLRSGGDACLCVLPIGNLEADPYEALLHSEATPQLW